MKRARTSQAFIWLGAAGLLACVVLLALHARAVARARSESRSRFEAHRGDAGEMVHVAATRALRAFAIDRTEVTVATYRRCVEAGACSPASQGEQCNWGRSDRDSHPINCVDHGQAATFCAWAGRRLPTAEEWEYAGCRRSSFPWNVADPVHDKDCFGRHSVWEHRGTFSEQKSPDLGTCPVDAHPQGASPFGVLGIAGNVSEWTATEETEAGTPSNRFVEKGGSWIDRESSAQRFRCAESYSQAPHYQDALLGFRCARSEERSLVAEVVSP